MSKRNRKPSVKSLVDVALLTAGYVDPPVFRECVSAIKREMETVPSSMYVCINGKVPETQQAYSEILSTIPDIHVKQQSVNVGYPRGANQAIKSGTSPLVLFVSDDIILHEGALKQLVKTMDDPQIGLCGMKLLFPKDSQDKGRPAGRVQHIGHAIDIQGQVTHPLIGWKPDNPKCCVSREVQSVTGAAFMVRRSVFLKAGGFFEGYGMGYFEDVDLNLTIRTLPYEDGKNYKVWIDAEAQADHFASATFLKKQQPVNMDVNRMILYQRKSQLLQNDNFIFW